MFDKLLRGIKAMELEEQILHGGVLLCAIGVFFPWFGGQWFGTLQQWSGFGFYTGYIGMMVFLLQILMLTITLVPMAGGPVIVRKSARNYVRFVLSSISAMLIAASFTVLLRVTFEVSGAEIRMGVYVSFVGSVVAMFYAGLKYREQLKSQVRDLFHHPDEQVASRSTPTPRQEEDPLPPPPPPPPPLPPENHTLFN